MSASENYLDIYSQNRKTGTVMVQFALSSVKLIVTYEFLTNSYIEEQTSSLPSFKYCK